MNTPPYGDEDFRTCHYFVDEGDHFWGTSYNGRDTVFSCRNCGVVEEYWKELQGVSQDAPQAFVIFPDGSYAPIGSCMIVRIAANNVEAAIELASRRKASMGDDEVWTKYVIDSVVDIDAYIPWEV